MAEEPRPPAEGNDPVPNLADRDRRATAANAESASWHRMSGIGFEFIAALGLGAGVGWWLDGRFGSSPWLLVAGSGLGFAVGLWSMVKAAQRMMK